MNKITVLGSGGFGMALALCAYNNGCKVSLWSPFKEEVELLNILYNHRENAQTLKKEKSKTLTKRR